MESPTWKWKLAQTLEYKWWQNYLQNKDADQYIEWKFGYWKKLLDSISPYIDMSPGKKILDAGCGPAGIFMNFEGSEVDATDPLLQRYKDFQHFQPDKFSWVKFHDSPMEKWKEKEKYDLVFCMNAINHVNDIQLCYDNLVNALKPKGRLVISTDAHRHAFLKKIFQWIPGDMLHPVQLDIEEYDHFLQERKMQIVKDVLYKRETIFDYYITIAEKI